MDDVLNHYPLKWEDRYFLSSPSINVLRFESVGQPGTTCKVDSLTNVEASAEACVVAPWQGQHKLTRFLECLVNSHLKD